jgi:type I restriction enzyme M protein
MAKRHQSTVGNLQSVFVRLEELVLANSGQDEFQEIYKLTMAKLYDERFSKKPLFVHEGDSKKTFSCVVELLRKAESKWPGVLPVLAEPKLTPDHLAICVTELQRHNLLDEGLQALDEFFEFIVSGTSKGNKGQYFTPRHLVEMCVRMIDPKPGEMISDPACGSGGFLMQVLRHVQSTHKVINPQDMAPYLWGFDIDERATQIARALMIIAGVNEPNMFRLNSLISEPRRDFFSSDSEEMVTIEAATRSRSKEKGVFDVIVTNPPFAGEIQERAIIEAYDLGKSRVKVERDILFLERCVRLLKPGGRMAIVLPHNKLAATAFTDVREWTLRHCHLLAVVGVGRNMFMPHTQQKTGVVIVRKKLSANETAPNVFFAMTEKDGKDSRGNHVLRKENNEESSLWQRLDHDLDLVVTEFHKAHAA